MAFSIPALAHLKHRLVQEKAGGAQKRRGPMMLILAPTRELAQQSQDVLEVAGKYCGIRSVAVYGGVSKVYIFFKFFFAIIQSTLYRLI